MTFLGIQIPTALSAAGTFSSIYLVFSNFEDIQEPENKTFVSNWLRGLASNYADPRWDAFFQNFFVRVFGERHFSLKCAFRSTLLSLIVLAVILGVWYGSHPELFSHLRNLLMKGSDRSAMRAGFAGVFAFACIQDYLSLYKTRLILNHFSAIAAKIYTIGVVLLDAISTIVIFGLGFTLSALIWNYMFLDASAAIFLPRSFLETLFEVAQTGLRQVEPFPVFLLLLAALLTSAWLWTYLLLAAAVRLVHFVPPMVRLLGRLVDLNAHPVRALGLILALLASGSVALIGIA